MLILNDSLFNKLLTEAEESKRKRSHYNIHQNFEEPVQRLCIALKKGTYVRPHCHTTENFWEMMVALKGRVIFLEFDIDGLVLNRIQLNPGEGNTVVEYKPNTWHMVFPVDTEAVILEVKEGPFKPGKTTLYAEWAPEEGEVTVSDFLSWALKAMPGEKYLS